MLDFHFGDVDGGGPSPIPISHHGLNLLVHPETTVPVRVP